MSTINFRFFEKYLRNNLRRPERNHKWCRSRYSGRKGFRCRGRRV
nr:MAG TPA: hypothetical protein [Caudoviricetes sp.]